MVMCIPCRENKWKRDIAAMLVDIHVTKHTKTKSFVKVNQYGGYNVTCTPRIGKFYEISEEEMQTNLYLYSTKHLVKKV